MLCTYVCLHVNLCTYVSLGPESCLRRGSDAFTPRLWSEVQTATGSRVEAWDQMSGLLLFPSPMTLLTDLTVSASLSPGGPPPPPAITTTHSSLSWLTGLGYTTAGVTSHLLGCEYVCVVQPSHGIQTLIFQSFSACWSKKIMESNAHKQTDWLFPPHSSSTITELATQSFSPLTVILSSSLQCSLRFLTNCLFSHLNTSTPPPCSAHPRSLLLSSTERRKAEGRGGEKTAFLFVAQCNYVG